MVVRQVCINVNKEPRLAVCISLLPALLSIRFRRGIES